jgi:primosomal replication protein N
MYIHTEFVEMLYEVTVVSGRKQEAIKTYGEVKINLQAFLTSELSRNELSALCLSHLSAK